MKTQTHILLFFLIFLNNHSNTTLEFGPKNNFNCVEVNLTKKDSVPSIPDSFLELQKNSKGYCLVKGSGTHKEIALTFDDGPTEVSLKIIKILNKYNAKATFFWVGERIKGNEKIIQQAKESGHLIANHSWNHENGYTFSNQLLWESQVEKTQKEFSDFGIKKCTFYRPPFGAVTQEQIDFLATKNIKTVLWSITSMDWDPKENHEGQMFQKFKDQFHPGAIVLFHDYDYGNLDAKLKDLENILEYGKSQGYQFVTVDKLQH
jgi:peptidoglycan/xylan/chitin deacetylase (PgdA/CDA1 family)